ncbi:MAG: short chain dehydrogenase family protein [Micavibrio sp.]|nr:short chain dehydrogenase family protein [Micavibrio sp.]
MPINPANNSPQTIFITGASSGIGEALALFYAAPGVTLYLTGRNAERLRAVTDLCGQQGARAESFLIDVTDRAGMERLLLRLDAAMPIDLVIANAGISGGTGAIGGESADQVREIFATNVDGVFNTVLPLMPVMTTRGCGQIAVMSSLAAFTGWPGAPAYSASKAAVRIFGEALRGSLRQSGVKVSVVCPGFIESRMTAANEFRMPLFMPANRAAAIIARGLANDRGRIAFPWPTYLMSGLIGMMPLALSSKILTKLPQKAAIVQDK